MYLKIVFIIISFIYSVYSLEDTLSMDDALEVLNRKINDIYWVAQYPLVIQSIKQQNAKNISLEKIKEIDKEWTGNNELTHLKKSMYESETGKFIKSLIDGKKVFSEVIVTDNKGANVAAFPITTDYWQGDEDKWKEVYDEKEGKLYIGQIEYDESSKTKAVQISVPVLDKGNIIGVLIVGIKLSYIKSKKYKKTTK